MRRKTAALMLFAVARALLAPTRGVFADCLPLQVLAAIATLATRSDLEGLTVPA